jgi:hypothetical protein
MKCKPMPPPRAKIRPSRIVNIREGSAGWGNAEKLNTVVPFARSSPILTKMASGKFVLLPDDQRFYTLAAVKGAVRGSVPLASIQRNQSNSTS